MPRDFYADVLAFHKKFGCAIGAEPGIPDAITEKLRYDLVNEEICEFCVAHIDRDLPALADAIVDSIYVLLGTAITYGIDIRPVWDAVHAANMAKEGGATRTDGKILKPAGWTAPDIAAILEAQKSVDWNY